MAGFRAWARSWRGRTFFSGALYVVLASSSATIAYLSWRAIPRPEPTNEHVVYITRLIFGFSAFVAFWSLLVVRKRWWDLLLPTLKEKAWEGDRIARSGPFLLYLRPFERMRGGLLYGRAVEHALSEAVKPVLETLEIAEPGRALDRPALERSGIRVLVPVHQEWRDRVRELMRAATLTVIELETSPGLLWEIGEARSLIPPERLVLLGCHDTEPPGSRQAWERALGLSLPPRLSYGFSHLIGFDPDWTARPISGPVRFLARGLYGFDGAYLLLRCELAPALARLGIRLRTPWSNQCIVSGVFTVVFVLWNALGLVALLWSLLSTRGP